MQQLTLHLSSGADAALLSDILLESFGAYAATVTDRGAGTASEQALFHQMPATADGGWDNVLVDSDARDASPLWADAVVTAFFPDAPECSLEDVTMSLLANFRDVEGAAFAVAGTGIVPAEVMARNWVAHVQQAFQAVTFGGLRVRAPWHAASTAATSQAGGNGKLEIILSPGQAFGTGEHPTTQLVASWLQDFASSTSCPPHWSVLDYGCGSGILAVAAVLLGAESAVGCDLDAKAVATANENARLNECADRVRFGVNANESEIWKKERPAYSIVVANILASTLQELAPLLIERVSSGGILLLSGILAEQATAVTEVFAVHGMVMSMASVQSGWVLLSGRKAPATI